MNAFDVLCSYATYAIYALVWWVCHEFLKISETFCSMHEANVKWNDIDE